MEATSPPPSINVAGYFKGVMGTGEHARQLVAALHTQGIAVTTTLLHPDAAPEGEDLADNSHDMEGVPNAPSANLICVNADSLAMVAGQLGRSFFNDRYTIGFWAWEVNVFPERLMDAFGLLDEVWVGSRHVRDAVGASAPVPVVAIPQPVSLPSKSASAAAPTGLPGGFRFLFAFDYLSVFERKNPLAAIEAFRLAFAPSSGATLIVKGLNPDFDRSAHERLRAAAAAHPDVHLIEDRLSSSQRDGLMNAADCYVSLHRAEGFGYTLAEAMWLGKPVIATSYSGNLDYMSAENSYLVSHRLVPIGPGHEPYPSDGVWADPDVGHAATLMRNVFEQPDEARRRGERAAADIRATHAPEVAGRVMAGRLRTVAITPGWHSALRRGRLQTQHIAEMIRSGPPAPAQSRFGAAQRVARKLLLRLAKPVTVHQNLINAELVKATEDLHGSLSSLAATVAGDRLASGQPNLREHDTRGPSTRETDSQ